MNYDGFYGINNVNQFLQSGNPGKAAYWVAATYKVGDPVLFGESERLGYVHKSQGPEYNSVKIVITDANEDDISHGIFYTAITRAHES